MRTRDAVKIAIECIHKEMQRLAPEANIYRITGNGSPFMKKAYEQYAELADAIKTLEQLPEAML